MSGGTGTQKGYVSHVYSWKWEASPTIVNVSHDEADGILWWRHLPTTVAKDGDLYAIHHTILAAANLYQRMCTDTLVQLNLTIGFQVKVWYGIASISYMYMYMYNLTS